MSTGRTYRIGINTQLIGKPARRSGQLHTESWQNLELTLDQFVNHIKHGHAFSAHFRESYRKTDNFICSSVVAADIDGTMTLEEAIGHQFIKDNAAFIYTTVSHREDEHRFRVVFLLEQAVVRSADWADCLFGLAIKLGSDPSIKDSGRLFYGNREAIVEPIGHTLSTSEAQLLIEVGRSQRRHRKASFDASTPSKSPLTLSADTAIRTANGDVVLFKDLPSKASVFCPFHLDRKHSAFVIRSHRGVSGIHCMSCNASFWQEPPPQYDFGSFDRFVERRASLERGKQTDLPAADGRLDAFFPPDPIVMVTQERFLPPLTYADGITVVKSPKGSGKTEALKQLIKEVKTYSRSPKARRAGFPKSILLVGHRQSLIKEAAKKLGLNCYIDNGEEHIDFKGFATSLDSLYRSMESKRLYVGGDKWKSIPPEQYDLLILDESEQVFSHLTAETLAKNNKTFRAYRALSRAMKTAKSVVALDADLGLITLEGLKVFRPDDWQNHFRIIYNKPVEVRERRKLQRYTARKDLEAELISAIGEGKRCFVVSNSKKAVDTLEELIHRKCGKEIVTRKITSDNSRNPAERKFVGEIATEFRKIQVLLCSPSLGTGIDITFPDGKQEVDHVFGVFYPFINTHMDIDQQLARVRHPGAVSVWFDPTAYGYETSFEVIRDDLARGYWVENAITGEDADGRLLYDEDHPLLLIMSHIISARRSSQNSIIELFERLRRSNGWDVEVVDRRSREAKKAPKGGGWKEAAEAVKRRNVDGILEAKDISDEEVVDLYDLRRSGETLRPEQALELRRGELRMTFNVPITREFVELALDGRLRERVQTYRHLRDEYFGVITRDYVEELIEVGSEKRLAKTSLAAVIYIASRAAGVLDERGQLVTTPFRKPDLETFVRFCRKNQTVIEEIAKVNLRDDLEVNPVRQLNQFLAFGGMSVRKAARKRRGGSPSFEYVVNLDAARVMDELAKNYRDFDGTRDSLGDTNEVADAT